MVKKFMGGLIGKKAAASDEKNVDVPDELPPLAEDAAASESAIPTTTSAPAAQAPAAANDHPPEELPQIEEVLEPVSQTLGNDEGHDAAAGEQGKDDGFFSNLFKIVKKQGVNEKLLDRNLYQGMKSYHTLKGEAAIPAVSKKDIEDEIKQKLEELQLLEKDWQRQKDMIEDEKRKLADDERRIQAKVEELKPLLRRINLYKEAPVGKYFRSDDGVIAKNVVELLELVKIMDDGVFRRHVSQKRNDVAAWVRAVVDDRELAAQLAKAHSKREVIVVLEGVLGRA